MSFFINYIINIIILFYLILLLLWLHLNTVITIILILLFFRRLSKFILVILHETGIFYTIAIKFAGHSHTHIPYFHFLRDSLRTEHNFPWSYRRFKPICIEFIAILSVIFMDNLLIITIIIFIIGCLVIKTTFIPATIIIFW